MRRKRSGATMVSRVILLFIFISISTCDGVRRNAQRRKDSYRSAPELRVPTPTAESLQALAEATGAAGFEHYTEGRALVKRLIPADSQSDVDMVEHQGVIGKAGVDFPAFPSIPNTGFSCKNVPTGYYADLETDCQVFHICDTSRKISFLCPNGTIFSQSHLICDWWFKVDCASSPALYESSAEYYSNEQKRTRKITKSLSKNSDLQQIGTDTNIRAESRRTSINVPSVPSTTERLLRHRQRLQSDFGSTLSNVKATARSFQALFADKNFNPTQKSQATTAFDKRRKNLVQLITNTFGNPTRTTLPTYPEASTYKTTVPVGDHNSIKEMQVAAETASFAGNNNRQYLQDYNSKNFRPYPVYTPNVPKVSKTKSNPNLTTLYDIRDKHLDEYVPDSSTKRSTLIPYTKSYTNILNDKLEPYTRPGVSLLKGFLEKERNRTLTTTTQTFVQVTERSDQSENVYNNEKKITIESNNSFESATKIPQTTRADTTYFTDTSSSNINDIVAKSNESSQVTTEASYQERRERLLRKLNLETLDSTESTLPTGATEKFYGNLPNRPGLVVPPSLTPKTLHTLAIYYATALDNLSTTLSPEETETTIPPIDEYDNISDSLPSLFSRQTINKYDSLFGQGTNSAEILEEMRLDPNGTYNELVEDLAVQQSQNPLATSPQIRELAQVFTHALSAYLQDPVQFRKVLSDIRPTQPSFGDMYITTEESVDAEPTTTINEDDDEILGFSDDNKIRPVLASLRDSKALNIATDQPTTIQSSTDIKSTSPLATSAHNPFRCCGRISASYTTASVPKETTATPITFTNLSNNVSQVNANAQDNSYTISKYGGFQNNSVPHISPYGEGLNPIGAKPLNEYVQATNLPLEWGVDVSTSEPVNNALNLFESKKIKKTSHLPETTTPIYFTETDSVELENEEELQRAHSQSFVGPKNNELRHGKQLNLDETTTILQKPSDDLEVPTVSNIETTTIQVITSPTTQKIEDTESTTSSSEFSSIFTSPENDLRTTQEFQWPNLENWHSTIILDPFTVNDGLSSTGPDRGMHQLTDQTNSWTNNFATTPSTDYTEASEATSSPTINIEVSTPGDKIETRFGRLLKQPTATESGQDLTTIADTVAQKAKEIMGGMNSTTTEKLMNVMKKTKSKSVKRLILLLIQTCDDDHNTTAEASKKALLEALMAVSQKDMDEIAKESDPEGASTISVTEASISTTQESTTEFFNEKQELRRKLSDRRGKSLDFDLTAINSLSNPSTTESIMTTEAVTETLSITKSPPKTTPTAIRRGAKKFLVRTGTTETKLDQVLVIDGPRAEARVASEEPESKTASDTRALELLRSLYTIAARWG